MKENEIKTWKWQYELHLYCEYSMPSFDWTTLCLIIISFFHPSINLSQFPIYFPLQHCVSCVLTV